MKQPHSLDEILGSFDPTEPDGEDSLKERKPITIWLPAGAKARYDRLQDMSGRRFGKMARELLLAAIAKADSQAS